MERNVKALHFCQKDNYYDVHYDKKVNSKMFLILLTPAHVLRHHQRQHTDLDNDLHLPNNTSLNLCNQKWVIFCLWCSCVCFDLE